MKSCAGRSWKKRTGRLYLVVAQSCDADRMVSMEVTRWEYLMEGTRPKVRHHDFPEWVTWMGGSEWAMGGPGCEQSVTTMDGETIRGYRKECFAKQLLSSVLVVVVECMRAQATSSMGMMQDQYSPWMAIQVLRMDAH